MVNINAPSCGMSDLRASHGPIATGAAIELPSILLDRLRAQGYLILDGLVDGATIEKVALELEPWMAATPRCRGDFYGWNTTRVNSVLMKAPSSHVLALHPVISAVVNAILGSHCDVVQLNLSQAVRLHPGERQQLPHRDDEMWPCHKGGIEYMVNVFWPLSDFTAANGATLLWPRSQYRTLARDCDLADAIPAEMPPGSALIYLGSITHAGGANRTEDSRTGLIFSYSLGWLKPYENPFLAYPPGIARAFPKPLQELIGYRIHRPNLGHYEGQDPSVALESGALESGALESEGRTFPTVDALPEHIAEQLARYYVGRDGS